MPKRSSSETRRRSEDVNEAAYRVVQEATKQTKRRKNPAAVALGRRGGKKGGKARAEALSPERRAEIARKAAAARWSPKNPPTE